MTEADAQRALSQLQQGCVARFEGMGHLLHLEPKGYEVVNAVSMFLESL